MRISRYILIPLSALLIGTGGYFVYTKISSPSSGGNISHSTSTTTVLRGDIINSIDVNGKAELANEQKLRFGQNGKITDIYVKVGDGVEK